MLADGDYTNHASVQAAAARGVDFYGSWKPKWEPGEYDAHGRGPAYQAKAFVYDAANDRYTCAAGQWLVSDTIQKKQHGLNIYVSGRRNDVPELSAPRAVRTSESEDGVGSLDYLNAGTRR